MDATVWLAHLGVDFMPKAIQNIIAAMECSRGSVERY